MTVYFTIVKAAFSQVLLFWVKIVSTHYLHIRLFMRHFYQLCLISVQKKSSPALTGKLFNYYLEVPVPADLDRNAVAVAAAEIEIAVVPDALRQTI